MSALVPWKDRKAGVLPAVGSIVTTLPVQIVDGRVKMSDADKSTMFRAMTSSEAQFVDLVNTRIEVRDIVVHWVDRTDEQTGEVGPGLRVAVITPDGTIVSGGSSRVYQCLALAMELSEQQAPYDPPLRFVVKADKRKSGPGVSLYLEWEL
jgi:hypothetical protein